jgi:hypothetical protein
MQVDISRPTFDATKHFASLLHQQGRVPLDADFNEQTAILLHQLRTIITDLVGPAAMPLLVGPGMPAGAAGFQIEPVTNGDNKAIDLRIAPGRAYVDGILVENEVGVYSAQDTWARYSNQPDGYLDPDNPADGLPGFPFAVYLRVWERLITALQDPAIREIALGDPGPDTAARVKVIWQVALLPLDTAANATDAQLAKALHEKLAEFGPPSGLLAARAKRPLDSDNDPCHLPPEAKFRGPENQLYRVEVHSGGPAWQAPAEGQNDNKPGGATFKWSRENASVVLPIRSIKGAKVFLASLGRDGKLGLEVGGWVEISDDAAASRVADDRPLTEPRPARALRQVAAIDYEGRSVTLSGETDDDTGSRQTLHPVLRRWDHTSPTRYESKPFNVASDGALPLVEGEWIMLEDGVEVKFQGPPEIDGTYRGGNYWTIPARTVTGDVEWPQAQGGPVFKPSDGVRYHYAALGFMKTAAGNVTVRPKPFTPITS